jgi:SHS2 domain-containing protein
LIQLDYPVAETEGRQASRPAFQILEHPADIGFRAFGGTLPELFENSALALVSISSEIEDVEPRLEYPLEADGSDWESLLVAWLSEVLYWFDGKRISFCRFRIRTMDSCRLKAVAYGEPRNSLRHHAKPIVKAVTWHQLKISPAGDGWKAEVYLDI